MMDINNYLCMIFSVNVRSNNLGFQSDLEMLKSNTSRVGVHSENCDFLVSAQTVIF